MTNFTQFLLLAIGISFILQLAVPFFEPLFIFHPLFALSQPWRFVTSIFLHGGLTHLFFNGYALLMFGNILERRIGSKAFLIIFFLAGAIGSISYYTTYILGIIPPIPALGASGAIYGILGAVAVLIPDLVVYFWFFPLRIRHAAVLWVFLELAGSFDTTSGIASAAHLGGLLFGLAYGYYLKNKLNSDDSLHTQSQWE